MALMLRKLIHISLISSGLFILESIIKYNIVNKIPTEGFYLIPKILQIIFVPNYNIAFGLPLPKFLIIFLIISALIFLSFVWWSNLISGNSKLLLATSLVIIGAFSNLIDRFTFGYVVDYINIFIWPIFNLADCYIVVGLVIYVIGELKTKKLTAHH